MTKAFTGYSRQSGVKVKVVSDVNCQHLFTEMRAKKKKKKKQTKKQNLLRFVVLCSTSCIVFVWCLLSNSMYIFHCFVSCSFYLFLSARSRMLSHWRQR